METIYSFSAPGLDGKEISLDHYQGKVILVVNTASQCGFTPQYRALEEMYNTLKQDGLVVLGFPCNQFGKQEPGNAAEIGDFCEKKFGVTFPLFAKVDVNGRHAHPLFRYLKHAAPGIFGSEAIKWNFTKFLVKKDGTVFKRYAPMTSPTAMLADISKLTGQK